MYVQPNTLLYLLSDVGIDNTYSNTHYFANVSAQHSYFISKAKHTLNNQMYVSPSKGKIRVQLNAEQCYNCTYLMFQNTAFGQKWFYGFITDIDYISNNCTEITFELDYLQTYLTEFSIGTCFVERMHVMDDTIGSNIASENISVGEYVGNEDETIYLNNMNCIVAVVDADKSGSVIDNVYSGTYLIAFTTTSVGVSNLNAFLQQFVNQPEKIAGIYMIPDCSCDASDNGTVVRGTFGVTTFVSTIAKNGSLNGYKPKNNKLYTYPYNFYRLSNGNGGTLNVRYEFCSGQPKVQYSATATQPVQLGVRLQNYKGGSTNRTEVLVTANYPICAWSNNTYQNWVGTQAMPNLLSAVGKSAVASVINPTIGLAQGLSSVSDLMLSGYTASISADTQQGSVSSGGVNLSKTFGAIQGWRMSVSYEYAKMIDDYFTRYGYAINKIVQPNISGRKAFNYIKTSNCCIKGNIPSSASAKISECFNKGITFWNNHANIGNFAIDNTL